MDIQKLCKPDTLFFPLWYFYHYFFPLFKVVTSCIPEFLYLLFRVIDSNAIIEFEQPKDHFANCQIGYELDLRLLLICSTQWIFFGNQKWGTDSQWENRISLIATGFLFIFGVHRVIVFSIYFYDFLELSDHFLCSINCLIMACHLSTQRTVLQVVDAQFEQLYNVMHHLFVR